MRNLKFLVVLPFVLPVTAFAGEDAAPTELRDRVNCTSIDGLAELVGKFDSLKADQRDTVDGRLTARLKPNDDGPMPERIFLKTGDTETDFTVGGKGEIVDFNELVQNPEGAEICFDDPAREGKPKDKMAFGFGINFTVSFIETPGEHSMASLQDGSKDGRAFYKKLAPGPAAMLVPKFKYVTITYEDENTQPKISAMKSGEVIDGLTIEPFYNQYVVSLKELEDLGADALRIDGGPYRLSPSPSTEKMEKHRKGKQ